MVADDYVLLGTPPHLRLLPRFRQQHVNWNRNQCDFDFATPTDYIEALIDYIARGVIPAGKLYTVSIGVPQSVMFGDEDKQQILFEIIEDLLPLAAEGKVVFATYEEVVNIWLND